MRSFYRNLLAVLVLAGCALPAAASDLDHLSVFVGVDPWSILGADYHHGYRYYDRHWPWYGYRYHGRPYGWRGRYHYPPGYWAPRHYTYPRYYRDRYYRDYHRWDDRRWRDRRWRDRHWREDDDRRDRHWRNDDRRDRWDGRRRYRGDD